MVKTENSEVSLQEVAGQEEELVELGRASEETRGLFFGSVYELSILPAPRVFYCPCELPGFTKLKADEAAQQIGVRRIVSEAGRVVIERRVGV